MYVHKNIEDRLIVRNVSKQFPGVKVLDDIGLTIKSGEVHALIGENGAGKSTLLKIICGIFPPDVGTIFVDGKKVQFKSSLEAAKSGISMVSQERSFIQTLSVAENMFMAHEPYKKGIVFDRHEANNLAKKILSRIKVEIDPTSIVEDLSVAQVQMVSIARALLLNPKILLLDEPTSSLTENEVNNLFSIIQHLKEENLGILYVSHRMEEIFQIADRVTVLRDGVCVGTSKICDTKVDDLISKMVGRSIDNMYPKKPTDIGNEAIRVNNLTRRNICEKIDFSIREGEIVGLFGLVGAGRTETARIIFGLDKKDYGEVSIFGETLTESSPSNMIKRGVGFLSEDRKIEGLSMDLSVRMNILRASLKKLFPSGIKSLKKEKSLVADYISKLSITTPSIEKVVSYLSGGTQQKVIFAHWMMLDSRILILDEPTKGIDVGAKVEIYKMLNQLSQKGVAILLISSDLSEIINISDRILVMRNGKFTGQFNRKNCSAEEIISCAIGVENNYETK